MGNRYLKHLEIRSVGLFRGLLLSAMVCLLVAAIMYFVPEASFINTGTKIAVGIVLVLSVVAFGLGAFLNKKGLSVIFLCVGLFLILLSRLIPSYGMAGGIVDGAISVQFVLISISSLTIPLFVACLILMICNFKGKNCAVVLRVMLIVTLSFACVCGILSAYINRFSLFSLLGDVFFILAACFGIITLLAGCNIICLKVISTEKPTYNRNSNNSADSSNLID